LSGAGLIVPNSSGPKPDLSERPASSPAPVWFQPNLRQTCEIVSPRAYGLPASCRRRSRDSPIGDAPQLECNSLLGGSPRAPLSGQPLPAAVLQLHQQQAARKGQRQSLGEHRADVEMGVAGAGKDQQDHEDKGANRMRVPPRAGHTTPMNRPSFTVRAEASGRATIVGNPNVRM
jgi:hypothetical protein